MLCTNCKKNQANVHIVTEVNGHRVEEHLCSECAEKQGKMKAVEPEDRVAGFFGLSPMRKMFSLMSGGDVADMAREFFGMLPEGKAEAPADPKAAEIAALRDKINEAVSEERYEDAAKLRDEIKKLNAEKEHYDGLKGELKKAIDEERYEDAAKLRDELKKLEKKAEKEEKKKDE